MTTPRTVRFLGTTDEVDTCDCCGRTGLKSTVALSIDDGEPVHFGVVCAARALSRPAREIRSESSKADRERAERAAAERKAAFDAHFAKWTAFLAATGTGSDVFTQIQSLGGIAVARALFKQQEAA